MPATERVVEGRLDDGSQVIFRPLRRDDREVLRQGVEALSPESRYYRFFTPLAHLSEDQLDSLTDVDFVDRVAWLAILPDDPRLPGVGVARFVRADDDAETAEAAVTVIDEYQRRGIGSALLRILTQSAIELGIKRFRAFVLGDNTAMLQMFEGLGATTAGIEAGVVEMLIPLPATVEALNESPLPRILRVAAEGVVEGRAGPRGWGTHFVAGLTAKISAGKSALKGSS